MAGILSGLRVIEMEAIGPVPFAGMMLADHGAEVLRIERPAKAADLGLPGTRVDTLGRGKASLALDLKAPEAIGQVLAIVATADVLIEGFRPGTMERMGLGPEACFAARPALVYGRMTGWGQTGPLAHTAGHDINYIALGGLLSAIGPAERPMPPLNLLGDFGGGGLMLAFGVMAALWRVARGGGGEIVDAAMMEGASLLGTALRGLRAGGLWQDAREANPYDGGAPWYDVYRTADGLFMAAGAIEARFYAEMLGRLGLDPATLPGQHDRARWPELRSALAARFATRTRAEWTAIFDGSDACVTPVMGMGEAPGEPHQAARGAFQMLQGAAQPAPAPRFAHAPAPALRPAPERGEAGVAMVARWMA